MTAFILRHHGPGGCSGIVPAGVVTVERDDLIADDPRRPVGRGRIDAMGIHVRFGAGDEEGAGEMQPMEAGEIDVAVKLSFGLQSSLTAKPRPATPSNMGHQPPEKDSCSFDQLVGAAED
jgi:hypothetical protein